MSPVMCHMSPITCKNNLKKLFGQSSGACQWRICYQRVLPHLVYINLLNTREEEKLYLFLLWTMVWGGLGYQVWQEFCCVWLELVSHECLGQSGIWTSFDG